MELHRLIRQARQRRTFHFVVKWQSGRASGEDLMGDHRSRKALLNSLLGGLSSFEGSHKGSRQHGSRTCDFYNDQVFETSQVTPL